MRANRSSHHAVAPPQPQKGGGGRRRGGFTLVEIMVVVIIIGVLATLVIANVVGQGDKARVKTTRAMLAQIGSQLDIFKLDQNRYPDALEELMVQPSYAKDWPQGGYLREQPVDGWGNKLIYRRGSSTGARPFELMSYGADGQAGGDGYDADLVFAEQQK